MKNLQYIIYKLILLVMIVLGLISSGCSPESKSVSVASQHNEDPRTLNEEDPTAKLFSEIASQVDQQIEAARSLKEEDLAVTRPWGAYRRTEWDLTNSLPNAVWSGTLVVDESCVYLDVSHILDDFHQDGYSIAKDVALRGFLHFPIQLVRLDTITGELWAGEYGPMSSGDEVVVVGSGNSKQDWSSYSNDEYDYEFIEFYRSVNGDDQNLGCFADTAFYVMSMQSSNSYSERPVLNLKQSHLIAGLSWEFPRVIPDVAMEVILDIEPPCIYGVPLNHSGELYPDFDRLLLELPRPRVHLKIDKNSLWNNYFLWVGSNGPMRTGEVVYVLGVAGPPAPAVPLGLELQEVGCSADGVLSASGGLVPVPNRYFQYDVLPTGT